MMNPALPKGLGYKFERKSGVKCGLCGYEFNEEQALSACKACAMMKGCKLIRCPNCNYEFPPEPKWWKFFREQKKTKRKGV